MVRGCAVQGTHCVQFRRAHRLDALHGMTIPLFWLSLNKTGHFQWDETFGNLFEWTASVGGFAGG